MNDLLLENHGQMMREWQAWTAVVTQLKNASASVDINEEPQLHAAMKLWGEELAILRRAQPEYQAAAYEDAVKLFNTEIGFLPY